MGASRYLSNLARLSRCRSETSKSGRRVFGRRAAEAICELKTMAVIVESDYTAGNSRAALNIHHGVIFKIKDYPAASYALPT
jgi:hypothetical protein